MDMLVEQSHCAPTLDFPVRAAEVHQCNNKQSLWPWLTLEFATAM